MCVPHVSIPLFTWSQQAWLAAVVRCAQRIDYEKIPNPPAVVEVWIEDKSRSMNRRQNTVWSPSSCCCWLTCCCCCSCYCWWWCIHKWCVNWKILNKGFPSFLFHHMRKLVSGCFRWFPALGLATNILYYVDLVCPKRARFIVYLSIFHLKPCKFTNCNLLVYYLINWLIEFSQSVVTRQETNPE